MGTKGIAEGWWKIEGQDPRGVIGGAGESGEDAMN